MQNVQTPESLVRVHFNVIFLNELQVLRPTFALHILQYEKKSSRGSFCWIRSCMNFYQIKQKTHQQGKSQNRKLSGNV